MLKMEAAGSSKTLVISNYLQDYLLKYGGIWFLQNVGNHLEDYTLKMEAGCSYRTLVTSYKNTPWAWMQQVPLKHW
jgi:hypothetical protein